MPRKQQDLQELLRKELTQRGMGQLKHCVHSVALDENEVMQVTGETSTFAMKQHLIVASKSVSHHVGAAGFSLDKVSVGSQQT